MRRNDIFYPLHKAMSNYCIRKYIINLQHQKKSRYSFFFVSVLHIRTSRPVRWHSYCLLGFCNEPRGTDLDTHDLLTTGRPYSSVGLLVSKGSSDGSGSLLRTRCGATIKEATVFFVPTRARYTFGISFLRVQHHRETMCYTFVRVREVKKPPHNASLSTLKR